MECAKSFELATSLKFRQEIKLNSQINLVSSVVSTVVLTGCCK